MVHLSWFCLVIPLPGYCLGSQGYIMETSCDELSSSDYYKLCRKEFSAQIAINVVLDIAKMS